MQHRSIHPKFDSLLPKSPSRTRANAFVREMVLLNQLLNAEYLIGISLVAQDGKGTCVFTFLGTDSSKDKNMVKGQMK